MENQQKNTAVEYGDADGLHIAPSELGGISENGANALAADPTSASYAEVMPVEKQGSRLTRILRRADIALLVLLVVGGIGLVIINTSRKSQAPINSNAANEYNTIQLPLEQLALTPQGINFGASSVAINGGLKVTDGITISPSVQPNSPTAGRMYYDQNTNQLAYFNGTTFVPLTASGAVVQTIGGVSGAVTLGGGLTVVGNQLTAVQSGVTSFGGQAGAITLGAGLAMNGNALQNSGLLNVLAGANIAVTNNGDGTVTINNTGAGTGTVTSSGGTAGSFALFTGSQNIEDSLISQSGTMVTITGDLNVVTGGLSLGNALTVSNGGTGATSLSANGVVIGAGTASLTAVTAGAPGLCFMSTAGIPAFAACPSAGGVTSLNGMTGAINVANASAAAGTVTIDNASAVAKGIASFNATNFTVTAGAVNTVQNIGTAATPSFGRLTVTSSQAANPMLVVNNTNVGATGNLLDLQLNGTSQFSVQPNGSVTAAGTINGQTISNAASFGGTLATAGAATIGGALNLNGGSLSASGALSVSASGTLTVGTATQELKLQGNSLSTLVISNGGNTTTFSFQAPTANVNYRLPTAALAGNYDICTTAGNCAGSGGGVTTGGGNTDRLAKFTSSQAINNSTITDNGTTVTTSAVLVVQGGSATVGVANSQTGSLILAYGSANFSGTVTQGTLTANRTYTLPDFDGTVCLSSGNCLGGGGGGANVALSNLSSVAINTSLLPGSTTIDLGSASAPFRNLYIAGSSLTPGTNNFVVTGAATAPRTIILPDATGTVCLQLYATCGFATGSGAAFVQNGNALGAAGNLGTNDANDLNLRTNSSTRVTIASGGNVTFSNNVAVNGGNLGSSGALAINPTGTLTAGSLGQTLVLQGNAATSFTVDDSGNTTALLFETPTDDVSYRFLTVNGGGSFDVCTTAGNCVGTGGGVTASGSSAGTIPVFTSAQAISNSLLSQSGGTVTTNGNFNLITGNQYRIDGVQISSAALSNDANLAKLGASQTFTGNALAFQNGTNSNNAFNIQNALGTRILTADTQNGQIFLGQGSALDGRLVFHNVSNNNTVTIEPGTPGGNRTLTLPNVSGIICTDAGNCAGAGATLQTAYNFSVGGTTPKIKLDSTLLGFDIQDADTTIGANLFNVRASNGAGLGSVLFGVGNTGQVTLQNSSNSASALRLLTQGGTSVLTGDTQNGQVVLGQGGTLTGSLVFNNATNSNQIFLTSAVAGGTQTITLPNATGTVCVSSGNCSGSGSSNTLQAAYDAGNLITTSTARDISITLADTATDSNFFVDLTCTTSCSNNGRFAVQNNGVDVLSVMPNGGGIVLGTSTVTTTNAGNLQFAEGANRTLSMQNRSTNAAGNTLVIQGANAGAGASAFDGGGLTLQAGNGGGTGAADGGTILIQSGNRVGGGDSGQVIVRSGIGDRNDFFMIQNSSSTPLLTINTQAKELYLGGNVINNSYDLTFSNDDIAGSTIGIEDSLLGEGDGRGLTLRAASTTDTNADGGDVTLTAGAGAGSGQTGRTVVRNVADSANAFLVQNAAGTETLLHIDTTARGAGGGNLIKVGDSTGTDTALTVLQLDAASANPTSNLAALNGGLFYNSTTGKVSLIENGQVKIICNTTDLGCGTGTVTLQNAYANSAGGTTSEIIAETTQGGLDIQDRSTNNGGTLGVSLFNVRATAATNSTAGTALFSVGNTGSATHQTTTNSTTAFQVQNAAGTAVLNVDTTNQRVGIGTVAPITQFHVAGQLPTTTSSTISTGIDQPYDLVAQGKYLYASIYGKLRIYDITRPTSLALVGSVNISTGPSDLFVAGHYAYVVANGNVSIVDITNASSPTVATTLAITSLNDIYVQGRYLYASTSDGSNNFKIYDLANPSAPVLVSQFAMSASASGIVVKGRYAYLVSGVGSLLHVLDVSNVNSVSQASASLSLGATPQFVEGRYLYATGPTTDTFKSVDISNPSSPSIAQSLTVGDQPVRATAQGRYAYLSLDNSGNGIQVIDISNPASMTSVGTIAAGGAIRSVAVQGRYAYAANYDTLQIASYDVGGAYIQQLEVGGIQAGSITTENDLRIGGQTQLVGGLSVGQSANINGGLGVSGSATVQNTSNSANGFRILNSDSTSNELVGVDSTDSVIRLLSNNSGHLGAFTSETDTISAREGNAVVALNGYLYSLGGCNSAGTFTNTVQHTKINVDGSVNAWATTSATLPNITCNTSATTYNGYIYVSGGTNSAATADDVIVGRPGADGVISSWTTLSVTMPDDLHDHSLAAYNGYLYVVGGQDTTNAVVAHSNDVSYAKINADGTIGAFTTQSDWIPANRLNFGFAIANGYMYIIGGKNANAASGNATAYYGKINANGSLNGATASTAAVPPFAYRGPRSVVMNGYIYVLGGNTTGTNVFNTVYAAPLASDGNIGTWTQDTTTMTNARETGDVAVANNYVYYVGGVDSVSAQNSVYYASATRVKIGASLDLIGYSGETQAEGGSGGQLSAGNTLIAGSLNVTGNAEFKNGASVVDNFSVNGLTALRSTTNNTAAFQVLNASNVPLFVADTTNSRAYIGNPTEDATGALLVLDNKNTVADPAGVNGAMYYNSALHEYRCYRGVSSTAADGAWEPCSTNPIDRGWMVEDEFLGGALPSVLGADTAIGNLGWTAIQNASPAGFEYNAGLFPTGNRPGTLEISTTTTNGSGTTLVLDGNQTSGSAVIAAGNVVKTTVGMDSNLAGAVLRVGLHDEADTNARPVSGVWWEAAPSVDSRWQFCYGNGTTATCSTASNTTPTVSISTWYRLEIRVTAVGGGTSAAEFFIDGQKFTVSGATIDSTNRVNPAIACFTSTASDRYCNIDYFQYRGTSSTAR